MADKTLYKTVSFYDPPLGSYNLIAPGQTRMTKKYFLFPKIFNRVKKRGFQIVSQESVIMSSTSIDGTVHFNRWIDKEFI